MGTSKKQPKAYGGEEAGEALGLGGLEVGRPLLRALVAEEHLALVEPHHPDQLLLPELRELEPVRVRIRHRRKMQQHRGEKCNGTRNPSENTFRKELQAAATCIPPRS
jgi:hypothetical protein